MQTLNKKQYDKERYRRRVASGKVAEYAKRPKTRLGKIVTAAAKRGAISGLGADRQFLRELVKSPPASCPVCETTFYNTETRDSSASLDRIDNTKGYIRGNVAIICHKCNTLKSDSTIEYLHKLIEYMKASPLPSR